MKIGNWKFKNYAEQLCFLIPKIQNLSSTAKRISDRSAYSMIVALAISALSMLLIGGINKIILQSLSSTAEVTGSHNAYFAAESGMEMALFTMSGVKPGSKIQSTDSNFIENNTNFRFSINGVSSGNTVKKVLSPDSPFSVSLYCHSCGEIPNYLTIQDGSTFFECTNNNDFLGDGTEENSEKYVKWRLLAKEAAGENPDEEAKVYALSGIMLGDGTSTININSKAEGKDVFDNIDNTQDRRSTIENFLGLDIFDSETTPTVNAFFVAELIYESSDVITCTFSVMTNTKLTNKETVITSVGESGAFFENLKSVIPYSISLEPIYAINLGESF